MVRAADLQPSPWPNGRGTTRTIASHRAPDGALLWMMGIADLVADAPFSHFPHADRLFTLLSGEVWLAVEARPSQACLILHPFAFRGDVPTQSRVVAPGQAFNVMWDRRAHLASVLLQRLTRGEALPTPEAPGLLKAVHCHTGHLDVGGTALMAGDTVLDPHGPIRAEADTVALIVSLHAAPS